MWRVHGVAAAVLVLFAVEGRAAVSMPAADERSFHLLYTADVRGTLGLCG